MSVISAGFATTSQRVTTTDSINQWDYGMILEVTGLPAIAGGIEFQFAYEHENETTTVNVAGNMVGVTASVAIPDSLLENNGMLLAYLYVTETATPTGTTERIIRIPVAMRQRPAFDHTPGTNAWAGFLQSISTERGKIDSMFGNLEDLAQSIIEKVAHLNMAYIFKGSTTFAAIPTQNVVMGETWNVEDTFVSDDRFRDNIGTRYPAGSTIVMTESGKWDTIDTNAYFALDEMAESFNSTTTYKKYDFCTNNSQLFMYISETSSAGLWDAAKWEPTSIGEQLTFLHNGVSKAGLRITMAEYDALPVDKQIDGTLYLVVDDDGIEFVPMEITQAEFDSMSQAQKDDGTLWCIIDGGDGNTNAELRAMIDPLSMDWTDITSKCTLSAVGATLSASSGFKVYYRKNLHSVDLKFYIGSITTTAAGFINFNLPTEVESLLTLKSILAIQGGSAECNGGSPRGLSCYYGNDGTIHTSVPYAMTASKLWGSIELV